MRAQMMAARVEFANLLTGEKAWSIDEVSRHEAVSPPVESIEPIGDLRVVRLAAIVEGQREWQPRRRQRRQRGEMRVELANRQLVTVGRR